VHGPGQKAALQAEQKAHFWLANIPAIKKQKAAPLQPNQETSLAT
jgi:hypothetical protein